jgi:hypothetical protein
MALSLSPKKLGLISFKGDKMKNKQSDSKVTSKSKDKESKFATVTVKIEGTAPLMVDGRWRLEDKLPGKHGF